MGKYRQDDNGVPVLSANDIELKAEEVIGYFEPSLLDSPKATPLAGFCKCLYDEFKVPFYCIDLGSTSNGNKILGKTQLRPPALYIDVSLQNDPRLRFTLGHEFGHLVLHRDVDHKKTGYANQEMADTEHDLVSGRKLLTTPRQWLEWQANRFSSAILMPRATFRAALISVQKDRGILRNLGQLFLTDEQYSRIDYSAIADALCTIYDVNGANIECRLQDLELLVDRRDLDVRHISEMFRNE